MGVLGVNFFRSCFDYRFYKLFSDRHFNYNQPWNPAESAKRNCVYGKAPPSSSGPTICAQVQDPLKETHLEKMKRPRDLGDVDGTDLKLHPLCSSLYKKNFSIHRWEAYVTAAQLRRPEQCKPNVWGTVKGCKFQASGRQQPGLVTYLQFTEREPAARRTIVE